MRLVEEFLYTPPKRSAVRRSDVAVLLAHGAGSDIQAASLVAAVEALSLAGVATLRFNYPYRTAGRSFPDRAPVLLAATRQAAAELARRSRVAPERLVLGGRSMGGRYCSLLAGDIADPWPALGLVLLGFPLHPPRNPEAVRDQHFGRLGMSVLFVSGTRDPYGSPAELQRSAKGVRGPVSWHWIPTADHAFRPNKREMGLRIDDAHRSMSTAVVDFVMSL